MHIEFVAFLVETFEAIALMSLIIQQQFLKDIDSGQSTMPLLIHSYETVGLCIDWRIVW